jgi:ATP-binding cassette subfamily B protein
VVHDLRNDVFRHLQRLPMSFFHRTKVGRIISRMVSDVEDVRTGVQEVLFVSLVQLGQMLVAAASMLWYDAGLFLLVLGMVPILWFINRHFHRRLSHAFRAMRDSFSRVTATLAESVNGIRITQGFVRQDTNASMFRELISDHARYNFTAMRTQGMFLPLLDLNNQAFVAALMIVGGFQALAPQSHVDIGDLVGFFFMASMFFSPINVLGAQYNQALTAMAGAERIFALLDRQPEWQDLPAATSPRLRGRVTFRGLSFGYDTSRPVLEDINFTVEPGQTVALVGHTGSGKTSIINLVAKFYLPTTGELLFDGVEIRQIRSAALHRQIAIVLQQNFLFCGTVMENIRYGRPAATDADVLAAVRQLDCLDMLEALPQGFQTQVGERGGSLSLGQRQIICFARAMIADPRILILDEATSSVDAATEHRIQQALARLVAGRTSFIVAHRLSTIRDADLVLVLEKGRIIERGTHPELVSAGGTYAHQYERFVRASAA